MGTPDTEQSKLDALNDLGGTIIPAHIRENFVKPTILDVGAGWGKYRKLLPEFRMDAVEIWQPYVEQENLQQLYRTVYVMDICDFGNAWYDIIILGDVLEHIDRERAIKLVEKLRKQCLQMYLVIPYQYHQGVVHDNKYEIHLQDDLTDSLIQELYGLKLLAKDDVKGVYICV